MIREQHQQCIADNCAQSVYDACNDKCMGMYEQNIKKCSTLAEDEQERCANKAKAGYFSN